MSVLIKGMDMPQCCEDCEWYEEHLMVVSYCWRLNKELPYDFITVDSERYKECPLTEVTIPHGRLIDADAIQNEMYHKSFETDDDRQKWDGGLWIRYKIFEESINNTPTIIESEDN